MIDIKKTYQTRDGRKVRIIATDIKSGYPVIAVLIDPDGGEQVETYTSEGYFFDKEDTNDRDLIEVIPKWRGKIWKRDKEARMDRPSYAREGWESAGWRLIEAEEISTTTTP